MSCGAYCTHGGVCILDEGHAGKHDTRYCQWDDADSLDKIEADRRLRATMLAAGEPSEIVDVLERLT